MNWQGFFGFFLENFVHSPDGFSNCFFLSGRVRIKKIGSIIGGFSVKSPLLVSDSALQSPSINLKNNFKNVHFLKKMI